MVGLFKQKSPGNVALLLIMGLLIKLPIFIYTREPAVSNNDGWIYDLFMLFWKQSNFIKLTASVLSFALLFVQAVMLNFMMNEYRMLARQNYLPGMAYLLITSLMPDWNYLSAPLMANTLVIWMFVRLFRLYNLQQARGRIFNIGLIAGIAAQIYLPAALFSICIIMGLMILKPFRFNEILLFLFGGLTVFYFYLVQQFLTNQLNTDDLIPALEVHVPVIRSTIWLAASTSLLTILFLMGGYFVQLNLRKMLIQVRKNWSILLLSLLLAFFVPFLNSGQTFYPWVLIAAPFACFHAAAYFYPGNRWITGLLFFIHIGLIYYLQYQTNAWH